MNTLLQNRETFALPADGWYQLAPMGEFPHDGAGVVQVIDKDACERMVSAFNEQSGDANFAGLLIDFDHFSLDEKLKSEAAGWIMNLQARDTGLWGRIRWSDVGEDSVRGGRYRFVSPVWSRDDCETISVEGGEERLRPVRLLNAAVTNDPNIKGMVPLSNRKPSKEEKHYRWQLGESEEKCPSCLALADQVHTESEWEKAGLMPRSGKLYCHKNCHCRMVLADGPSSGTIGDVPLRHKEMKNRDVGESRRSEMKKQEVKVKENRKIVSNREIPNNWSDAARAASIAVRKAKAVARKGGKGGKAPDSGGQVDLPASGAELRRRAGEPGVDAGYYLGGSKDFDERTGKRRGAEPGAGVPDGDYHTLPYPPPSRAELRDQSDDFVEQAMSAFQEKYGRKPATDSDIMEAEEMVDMPKYLRSEGAPITRDQILDRALSQAAAEQSGRDTSPEAIGEDFERTQDVILDYRSMADNAFQLEYGYMPKEPEDVQRGEEMAGVPDEYRTGGVFSPRELTQKLLMEKYEEEDMLQNNWSDAARARSLEVRRAKAAEARGRRDERAADGEKGDRQRERTERLERVYGPDAQNDYDELQKKKKDGEPLTKAEENFAKWFEHMKKRDDDYISELESDGISVGGTGDSDPAYIEMERNENQASEDARYERERENERIREEAPVIEERLQGILDDGGELTEAEQRFMDHMARRRAEDEAMMLELQDGGGTVQNRKRGAEMNTGKKLVQRLANALRFEKAKNKILLVDVVGLEDEMVNRRLKDAGDVVTDENREFWRDQLLTNRSKADKVLRGMIVKRREIAVSEGSRKRPLHNRRVVRPVVEQTSPGGKCSIADDGKAVKIRNRAHALSKAEGIPFSTAFRRAEKEFLV